MNTENFGKVEIIDNWVDEDLINHLSNQFLYRYPHFFVELSTPEGKANIYSNGNVFWSRPGIITSTCIFDLTDFPFDQQNCELKFVQIMNFHYEIH